MQTLVIGYGSIGARHARLLDAQGHDVICVTGNPECPFPVFNTIAKALERTAPSFAIISNATTDHFSSLETLIQAKFPGRILVEKPLFEKLQTLSGTESHDISVAYNLRFHSLVKRVAELLEGQPILSAQFHVGQYLPDWRPDTDYSSSYSASRSRGGGVLRDLSHELDLALWLLGAWRRVVAIGGKFSSLDIDSDDTFSVLMETTRCPAVTINLDYLNRTVRRGFDINTEGMSLRGDLVSGILEINGEQEQFKLNPDSTYLEQLQAFTCGENQNQCSFEQGLRIVELIEAIETSVNQHSWIKAT